jgi:hypothetical protein
MTLYSLMNKEIIFSIIFLHTILSRYCTFDLNNPVLGYIILRIENGVEGRCALPMTTNTSCYVMGGIRRPCGQVMINPAKPKRGSKYGLTRLLDFKLEVAFVISRHTNVERVDSGGGGGRGGTIGRPMTAKEAWGRMFGYILMND